jgi:hypothetical protein
MTEETIEGKAHVVGTARVDESRLPARQAVPSGPVPVTLWRTDDPAEVVKRATKAANALAPVLRDKGMITSLGGDREHVNIEGWQTLASMVGLVSTRPFTRELAWPDDERLTDDLRAIRDLGYAFGYDATYAVATLDGREVGGGEGTCKRTESAWCRRRGQPVDDYALKGMAQTRAQSRAFASPLRFVVELAGFSGTPAEEVSREQAGPQGNRSQAKAERIEPSQAQLNLIKKLVKRHGAQEKEAQLIRRFAKARMTGGAKGTASEVIGKLEPETDAAKSFARRVWTLANDWQGTDASTKPNEGPGASDVPADTEGIEQTKIEPGGDSPEEEALS